MRHSLFVSSLLVVATSATGMPSFPQLCGRVYDQRTLRPLFNARVVALQPTKLPADTTTTDARGVFQIAWNPRMGIRISAPGYAMRTIAPDSVTVEKSSRECCDWDKVVFLRRVAYTMPSIPAPRVPALSTTRPCGQ